jgi:hypothetical protein
MEPDNPQKDHQTEPAQTPPEPPSDEKTESLPTADESTKESDAAQEQAPSATSAAESRIAALVQRLYSWRDVIWWTNAIIALATAANVYVSCRQADAVGETNELTRQALEQNAKTIALTREGLEATKTSNDIAARAALAAEDQTRAIREQLNQGSESLKLGRAANAQVNEAMRLERRAWMGVGEIMALETGSDTRVHASVPLINSGATPALHVRARVSLLYQKPEAPFDIDKAMATLFTLPSTAVIHPGSKMTADAAGSIPEGLMNAIEAGTVRLFLFGIIDYCDIFGTAQRTTFCVYLHRDRRTFRVCTEHNEVRSPARRNCQ